MNTHQAKHIPLVEFLKAIGHYPIKQVQQNFWYKSPFRNENKASFKIDSNINVWYDFGLGKGGTIIDFVGLLKSFESISEILKYIDQIYLNVNSDKTQKKPTHFYFQQQKEITQNKQFKVSKLTSPILKQYLKNRAIKSQELYSIIYEADIINNNNTYKAIAFQNNLKGYELRNQYYKGCTSKSIRTIKRSFSTPIFVVEGFFDYLSLWELAIKGGNEAIKVLNKANYLIMNSTALVNQTIEYLKDFKDIRLFLDNDDTGVSTALEIQRKYPYAKNFAYLYKEYKDLNDYLIALNKTTSTGFISRCAIVMTETKVSADNSDLAFTPHGRKSNNGTINMPKENVREPNKCSQYEHRRKRGRGICR